MVYRRFAQVAQSRENLDVIKIVVVHPIGCAIGPRGLIRWREIDDRYAMLNLSSASISASTKNGYKRSVS